MTEIKVESRTCFCRDVALFRLTVCSCGSLEIDLSFGVGAYILCCVDTDTFVDKVPSFMWLHDEPSHQFLVQAHS